MTTGITTLHQFQLHFLLFICFIFQDQTFTVDVSAGKFLIDGVQQPELSLERGKTYRFDLSEVPDTHPFKFSTTADGSHNGGEEYQTGVTQVGFQGFPGAYIEILVDESLTSLNYYCTNHPSMGAAFKLFPALIEVTSHSNTLDNDNSGTVNAGDTIEYTIEVENIHLSQLPV